MPRARQTIPVSAPTPEPEPGTVAILQAEAKPDQVATPSVPTTVPAPAIPEFIKKQCGLLNRDAATIRIPYGPGRYQGRQYGLAHHPGGFPIITSGATGRMFAITWEALIKLAVAGGIDENGPESTVVNPRDL